MDYPISSRFRIWVRQWFFRPFAGWRTALYNYRQSREMNSWIQIREDMIVSKEGDKEPEKRTRPTKDLKIVRESIKNEGHHRG